MIPTPFQRAPSRLRTGLILFALLAVARFAPAAVAVSEDAAVVAARLTLLKEVQETQRDVADLEERKGITAATLAVLGKTPRQEFVPDEQRPYAYENRPLPIGHGQTISQPYMVGLMTDLLKVKAGDRVFELGTGSAYQSAILAQLAGEVYSVEIVPPLGERAARTLDRLGYHNVHAKIADGYYGWQEHAPFDAIIVTAAASHVPPPLVAQLKPGGRMVIPVGASFLTQHLMLVEKQQDGTIITRQILPVKFVPLTGRH